MDITLAKWCLCFLICCLGSSNKYFLCKRHHSFLCLGTLHSTLVRSGATNSRKTNESTDTQKTHGTKKTMKKRSVYKYDSWNKKVKCCPVQLQLGMCASILIFRCSVHVCEWLQKCSKYWFQLQTNVSKYAASHIMSETRSVCPLNIWYSVDIQ